MIFLPHWLKRSFAILSVAAIIAGASWVYREFLNEPFDDWWFDQKIWMANRGSGSDNPRGKMVTDLQKRVLPGMSREEVRFLLGPPDAGGWGDTMSYSIGSWSGFGMDPDILDIAFDKTGIVTAVGVSQT